MIGNPPHGGALDKTHGIDCRHLHVHAAICDEFSEWVWDLEEEYMIRAGLFEAVTV